MFESPGFNQREKEREKEALHTPGGVQISMASGKSVLGSLKKLKLELSYDLTISL